MVVKLIEDYEFKYHNLDDWGKSLPHEILQHIMVASVTNQVDLVGIIGSKGVISEVVNGSRSISKSQAKNWEKCLKYLRVYLSDFLANASQLGSVQY